MTGFPDWLVPVNISRQELAEITNRPKFGSSQQAVYSSTVGPQGTTTIISITGKGMIYGGFVSVVVNQQQSADFVIVIIDGVSFVGSSFFLSNRDQIINPSNDLFVLQRFDDINFRYKFGISYGFTFEESIVVQYIELHSNTFSILAKLYYALV